MNTLRISKNNQTIEKKTTSYCTSALFSEKKVLRKHTVFDKYLH